jgi:hypothetical protein
MLRAGIPAAQQRGAAISPSANHLLIVLDATASIECNDPSNLVLTGRSGDGLAIRWAMIDCLESLDESDGFVLQLRMWLYRDDRCILNHLAYSRLRLVAFPRFWLHRFGHGLPNTVRELD